ncbi:terpenoid synthase [Mycena rosella]|uniref:Terpene synthase n=1 Tax=Mycena rosella TaxID=1033263 RepID=A0AAD7C2V9_MYCRO|nr:terpenoid synthase [Mycena rosella]
MPAKDPEPIQLLFPDTLCNWPWPRHLNPHFELAKDESAAWLETFNAFSPKAQKAFNRCDFNLLASLAYPLLDKDGCRVGCDLMNLFFLIDEHFDKIQADTVMHALRNPHMVRPHGEWIGGEVTRQFWLNAIRIATPTSQRRFIDEFYVYMDSMVQKAQDRTEDHIRGIDEYFEVRRVTIGVKAAIVINEIRMNIPDEVLRNEHIATLIAASTDMILIANDLYSYNVEQARGDDRHNLVAIVMRALNLDLAATFEWISDHHDGLVEKFLAAFSQVLHYKDPELDHQVTEFIHGLGNWVRGYDVWSFESERYFGKRGKEIQVTRTVEFLPKVVAGPETVSPEILVSATA